jgi:hypothetical protein
LLLHFSSGLSADRRAFAPSRTGQFARSNFRRRANTFELGEWKIRSHLNHKAPVRSAGFEMRHSSYLPAPATQHRRRTRQLRVPDPPPRVPSRQNQSIAPSLAAPTVVMFSDELQNVPVQTSDFKFRGSTNEPPQTAQYLVAVSSAGEIRYCFLQDSSGDPALDEQGHHYLLLCRFALKKNTSANMQENLI